VLTHNDTPIWDPLLIHSIIADVRNLQVELLVLYLALPELRFRAMSRYTCHNPTTTEGLVPNLTTWSRLEKQDEQEGAIAHILVLIVPTTIRLWRYPHVLEIHR